MTPAPSPEFIRSLASWTWLEETAAGRIAFLLLAHPEPATVTPQLAGLADRMGLASPHQTLPDTGERVVLRGNRQAAVLINDCPHAVQVEVGEAWAAFARSGGPVAILLGLAPLTRRATQPDVEAYLGTTAHHGQLRLGSTHIHRQTTNASPGKGVAE